MDLQKLYESFTALVGSLSAEEMQRETERAIFESRDSYLLGDMDCFDEMNESEEVEGSFSVASSDAKFASAAEISDALDGIWGFYDDDNERLSA